MLLKCCTQYSSKYGKLSSGHRIGKGHFIPKKSNAKEWCWRRLLRVHWTARRSNQSILKEINPEYSLKGLMLKVKLQYFGPLVAKNWLIGKDLDAGKDWRQEEKRTTEDEMVAWHHRLDGHGFGWTPAVGDGQGGLACSSSWLHKESDMTERLKWTELTVKSKFYKIT